MMTLDHDRAMVVPMPTPRALDPDHLRELLVESPAMRLDELAGRLTAHNKALGVDRVVTRQQVTAAISRWRPVWEAGGLDLSARTPANRELVRLLVANTGGPIAQRYHCGVIMRSLRLIDRGRQGLPVPQERVRAARDYERWLRDERRVIDRTDDGRPFERPALPDELDKDGQLIEIVAAKRTGQTPQE